MPDKLAFGTSGGAFLGGGVIDFKQSSHMRPGLARQDGTDQGDPPPARNPRRTAYLAQLSRSCRCRPARLQRKRRQREVATRRKTTASRPMWLERGAQGVRPPIRGRKSLCVLAKTESDAKTRSRRPAPPDTTARPRNRHTTARPPPSDRSQRPRSPHPRTPARKRRHYLDADRRYSGPACFRSMRPKGMGQSVAVAGNTRESQPTHRRGTG
jgi:hypothetical protein